MKLSNGANIYYFGCRGKDQAGHYWQGVGRDEERVYHNSAANSPASIPKCVARGIDGSFYDERKAEGVAVMTYVNDCTILGFRDNSGDHRGGSHSAFVITMDHCPFKVLVATARKCFPEVFARFDFEVTPSGRALLAGREDA